MKGQCWDPNVQLNIGYFQGGEEAMPLPPLPHLLHGLVVEHRTLLTAESHSVFRLLVAFPLSLPRHDRAGSGNAPPHEVALLLPVQPEPGVSRPRHGVPGSDLRSWLTGLTAPPSSPRCERTRRRRRCPGRLHLRHLFLLGPGHPGAEHRHRGGQRAAHGPALLAPPARRHPGREQDGPRRWC